MGVKLNAKGGTGTLNFDVKAKLEEKERRSQMIIINFALLLTTKPGFVRFEVEGTATLKGKEAEIDKMLEPDPETKIPFVFNKIYQQAFTAMYLLSTILKTPPPPYDLLSVGTEQAPVQSAPTGPQEVSAEQEQLSENNALEGKAAENTQAEGASSENVTAGTEAAASGEQSVEEAPAT
ncbi:hypothetical protein H5T51_03675 [Candidatus Bathyarchaeota archaeon]|nr:hypothetical protein [Candidatus Bathyarchaeota archaeon]